LIARENALLVTCAEDILALLSGGVAAVTDRPSARVRPTDALAGETAVVYEALPGRGSRDLAAIAAEAGLFADETLAALGELELLGMAARDGAAWRRTTPGRSR
jgi:DNA processing protein